MAPRVQAFRGTRRPGFPRVEAFVGRPGGVARSATFRHVATEQWRGTRHELVKSRLNADATELAHDHAAVAPAVTFSGYERDGRLSIQVV